MLRVRHSGRKGLSRTGRKPRGDRKMTMFNQTGLATVGALAILVLVLVIA